MGPRKRRDTSLMEDTVANQREVDYQNQMSDLMNMVTALSHNMMTMNSRLNSIEAKTPYQSDAGTEASFVMTHPSEERGSPEDPGKS